MTRDGLDAGVAGKAVDLFENALSRALVEIGGIRLRLSRGESRTQPQQAPQCTPHGKDVIAT